MTSKSASKKGEGLKCTIRRFGPLKAAGNNIQLVVSHLDHLIKGGRPAAES